MESTSLSCGMSKSNACKNQKQPFANVLQDRCSWFEEVGNFRGFRVFDFSPYTEIENSENSEIFSRLVKLKEIVLFEEVGISEVSEFMTLTITLKLKNLENSKIFSCFKSSVNLFYLRKLQICDFSEFRFYPSYWNQKHGKLGNFLLLAKSSESVNNTLYCFVGGSCTFPRFPSFRF